MLRRTTYLLLAAFALCMVTAPATARNIFVNNMLGNDAYPGNSAEPDNFGYGPCHSITRALQLMRKGDVIIIANTGVPYYESITLQGGNNSGYETMPATIIGNGAVLEGAVPVPEPAWEFVHGELFRFLPPRQTFQQLYLDGAPAAKREIVEAPPYFPELQPLEWCQFEGHIYFRPEENRLPQTYNLTYAHHQVGITLYEARNVVISDLVIQGFRLDGVNAHDNVEAQLLGLICRGNGRSGVSVGGSSQVVLQDSLIGNNGQAQVRAEGYSTLEILNCDLLDNTAPPLLIEGDDVRLEGDAVDLAE